LLLVVGLPRSGTTWLAKIFDSHPRVVYRQEPDKIHQTGRVPWLNVPPYEPKELEKARTYLFELSEFRLIGAVGVEPIFPKSYLNKLTFALRRAIVWSFHVSWRLPTMGARLRKVPIPDFRSTDHHISVVIKSIHAHGRLGLFMAACPNLKTILIVQHPCRQLASVLRPTYEAI
jgi:sulfotransferase family protein